MTGDVLRFFQPAKQQILKNRAACRNRSSRGRRGILAQVKSCPPQEYFVYFKVGKRTDAAKDPAFRRRDITRASPNKKGSGAKSLRPAWTPISL
jgi:hypothetical protein